MPNDCYPTGGVNEAAADIDVTSSRMVESVANGWVIMAVPRHIPMFAPAGMDPWQREIFVRHQVGTGRYAEIFTVYYAHMQDTRVRRGQAINASAELGRVGTTGSSSGEHLHIAVHRHRNLSWRRSFEFDFSGGGRFDRDGMVSAIDPWGWNPPTGADPWAWRFRNAVSGNSALDNSGSFSTWLWLSGEAPPLD
ncbi:M23 family metallopeptidase [Dokdonella sp.]|uniref:M23 family metallopeptidase n=1 Tax=Dokdonella sp. TaxID=2291710 RepID=UPI003C6A24D6